MLKVIHDALADCGAIVDSAIVDIHSMAVARIEKTGRKGSVTA